MGNTRVISKEVKRMAKGDPCCELVVEHYGICE